MKAKRLLKLAEHLRHGKLGHKKFDLNVYNSGRRDRRGCGTNGCAIGEMPILDPRNWKFGGNDYNEPLLTPISSTISMSDASAYFDIPFTDVRALFTPRFISTNVKALRKGLPGSATKIQVARRIEAYVKEIKGRRGLRAERELAAAKEQRAELQPPSARAEGRS